jgi:hypothetical protein
MLFHMEHMRYLVTVFWAVSPNSDVVGYQHFRGLCCLHLHDEVKMEGVNTGMLPCNHMTS